MHTHSSTDIHLSKDLVDKIENLDFRSNSSLLEIQQNLEHCMNGLSTHDTPDSTLLITEYARNGGIISLPVSVEGVDRVVNIPGIIDASGNAIIFLSKVSIAHVPRLKTLLDAYEMDELVGSEYRIIHVSSDSTDIERNTLLSLIYTNYAASVTSPLKQDIVPLIIAGTGYNLPLQEAGDSNRAVSRLVKQKYLIGRDKDVNWFLEMREKHEAHYQNFFLSTWGKMPDSVFLTASGLSANAGSIRYISSQVPAEAMSVSPGYFFLNEVNFPDATANIIVKNTQAFFCAIEPGYAGLGDSIEYLNNLEKNIEQFLKNAENNPEKPYFFSIDVTSNLLSNELLYSRIEQMKHQSNIITIVTSSLTKYNRSEHNYHYGIVTMFGGNKADNVSMRKYISTSYGDISRLGVLQFPRLRPSEIADMKDVCQQNRQICMEVLLSISGIKDLITAEDHSAYSYIIPITEDVGVRNNMISFLLSSAELQKWQGSSFYHNSLRLCDVPDVACSRFYLGDDTRYKNTLRISWPTVPSQREMQELGNILASILLKV